MISVNGVAIDADAIAREAQYHPAASFDVARDQAARALAIRELLLQEARRQGIEPDTGTDREEEEMVRLLLEREIAPPMADEATLRRYFENNRARFRSPEIFDASHILFPALPDDAEARLQARHNAEIAIIDIGGRPDRFAEIAKARSACPSATQGGRLGRVGRGQTSPEIETFLLQIEPGTICPIPVPSRYGYHVLHLAGRDGGIPLPYEAVREDIAQYLAAATWHHAVRHYLMALASRARIEGIVLDGSQTPLVQ